MAFSPVTFTPATNRPQIAEAVATILDRHAAGETATAIVMPPRYGKSDVQRLTAIEAVETGLASAVLALAPWSNLADQIVDVSKITDMVLRTMTPPSESTPDTVRMQRPENLTDTMHELSQQHHMFSATIQKALHNQGIVKAWIDRVVAYGQRPIVFFDEAQLTSVSNKFGALVQIVQDAGAHAVLLTGTPYRADNQDIPGFEIRTIREEDVSYVIGRRLNDDEVLKETYEGVRSERILEPHYQVDLTTAWNQGSLCKIEPHWIGVDVTIDGEPVRFKDMKKAAAQRVLRKVVTHDDVIALAAQAAIDDMRARRAAGMPDAGILIVTASDIEDQADDGLSNWHARKFRKALHAIDPTLDIAVATMADDSGGKKNATAVARLNRFVGSKGAPGVGDVLIVKNMGTVGLDSPRLKTIVNFGTARQLATWVQTILRGGTVANKVSHFTLIMTNDIMNRTNWDFIVTSRGGEYASTAVTKTGEEIVDSPIEDDDMPVFDFDNAHFAGVEDSHTRGVVTDYRDVQRAIAKIPKLRERFSLVEIKEMLDTGQLVLGEGDVAEAPTVKVENTSDDCGRLRREIAQICRDLASMKVTYTPNDPVWLTTLKKIDYEAKTYAGIRRRLPEENDAEKLRVMRDYLLQMTARHTAAVA